MTEGLTSVGPSIVITYPYPIGQRAAGGSRTIREVARHLTLAGARVMIMPVSTHALSRKFPRAKLDEKYLGIEYDDELARDSIDVVRPPQNPFAYQLDCLSVRKALKRVMRERPVDIVLAHYHEAGFLPAMLKRRNVKFGFLATWQTYKDLEWRPSRLIGWGRKWLDYLTVYKPHREADVQLAISEFTRGELIDIVGVAPERIVVCPLGVEPTFLEIPRRKPEAITNLLFFGRITPSKGFFEALEALGRLRAQGIDGWNFRMVGEGREEWAREAAEKHGIADAVTIQPPLETPALAKELEQAHLAILPSHAESFGHAIVEAQASGIPVVSFATGSVPEVLEDGVTGWLAPLKDVERLTELIAGAVRDPEGTYAAGLRARERVQSKYTWTHTAATILEAFERVKLK